MAKRQEAGPSHVENVRDILFDSPEQMTDADHLAVVQRGIDSSLGTSYRKAVYDYAQRYIRDPEILAAAQVQIATSAVEGIRTLGYNNPHKEGVAENKARFSEGQAVSRVMMRKLPAASEGLVGATLELIMKMEGYFGRNSGYVHLFDSSDYEAQSRAKQELASMAANCLDAQLQRFPDTHPDIRTQFVEQAQFVPRTPAGDRIIERYLRAIDETTNNAVVNSFVLLREAESEATKRAILDRVVALTAASSKEPTTEQTTKTVKKMFGRIKEVPETREKSSLFRQRLVQLDRSIGEGNLQYLLDLHPTYIRKVVELHSPEQQEELWQQYANSVAGIAFTNGSYKISEIGSIMATVQRFGQIAPEGIGEKTAGIVKARLSQAKPTTSSY